MNHDMILITARTTINSCKIRTTEKAGEIVLDQRTQFIVAPLQIVIAITCLLRKTINQQTSDPVILHVAGRSYTGVHVQGDTQKTLWMKLPLHLDEALSILHPVEEERMARLSWQTGCSHSNGQNCENYTVLDVVRRFGLLHCQPEERPEPKSRSNSAREL